jgi:hypothetical protein
MDLKSTVNKLFSGEDIDRIIAEPMTQLRLRLKKQFSKKKFTEESFEEFLSDLKKIDPQIEKQIAVARAAIENREVRDTLDIELNTPAKQILWASVIARLSATGKEPVVQSKFWGQLINATGFYNQAISTARLLSESIQNTDTTFSWGQPGSWFYHDPRRDHVNLDAFYTLLVGFEHIRPINAHEVGHSELSDEYPPWMKDIYQKILGYIDPDKAKDDAEWQKLKDEIKKLPPDEQIKKKAEIMAETTRWRLSHRAWNCFEDLTVDQFAIDLKKRMKQDYGDSLNYAATILRGYAEIVSGQDKDGKIEVRTDSAPIDIKEGNDESDKKGILDKIKDTLNGGTGEKYGDYIARPLNAKEIADVKSGNVSPRVAYKMYNQITWGGLFSGYIVNGLMTDKPKNWERMRIFRQDIDALVDVSGIPEAKGMTASEYLFKLCSDDKDSIRVNKPSYLDRVSLRPDCVTVEGSYKKTVRESMAERNKKMQHIYDVFLKQFIDVIIHDAQQKIENNLKNPKKNDKSNNKAQGEGEGGQGDPSEGDPGDGGEEEGGGGQSIDDPFDDARDDISGMGKNAKDTREKEESGNKKSNDNKKKKEKSGWDQDPSYDKKAQQNKVGDMKDRGQIKDDFTEEEKEKMRQDAKSAGGQAKSDLNGGGGQAGMSRGAGNLGALAKASWKDYQRRKIDLAPVINQVAAAFKRVRDEQTRSRSVIGSTYDFMPEDGDVAERLDRERILERRMAEKSGREMTVDDLKSFREDKTQKLHASIELSIMIDGSDSMTQVQLGNGATAMETALQSAVILYEAALKVGIAPYILMWGDAVPTIIANPKSSPKEVGQMLEYYRNGTRSGTELKPGIQTMVAEVARFRNGPDTISGSSHIAVLSDGDIFDAQATKSCLATLSRNAKNMSVDVAVLKAPGNNRQTNMETVIKETMQEAGSKMVGLVVGNDANRVPLDLAQQILRRVRSFKVKVEPDKAKRDRFKKIHNKLDG